MTVTRTMVRRKEKFGVALMRAKTNGKAWREGYYKAATGKTVSWQHLNECFAGRRVMGAELKAVIDRFISEQGA